MARPLLEQLLRTHAVFSARYWLDRGLDVPEVVERLRTKFPEAHYQSLRGLVLRVAKAQAAAALIQRGRARPEVIRAQLPRFEGWQPVDPEFANRKFHYDVIAELRTRGGRTSHFRTLRVSSDELLTHAEIAELAQRIVQRESTKRDGLSPPKSQQFNRVLNIEVTMAWRS